ncbi:restriction endonuclease subunit S [Limosilactobacillus mucosae]|uniref:restriction endonuclease subunit S n=1 Tax=Limosilactobacillus mucosae TaxID=97478 RepID=UPI001F57FACA|nr:restriction endonuclease subunit S [Limosilactobacillus mucosae]
MAKQSPSYHFAPGDTVSAAGKHSQPYPWEQRKLGDLGSVQMNKRIFKDQTSESGEVPFFKIGTFGKKPDSFISKKLFDEYKSKYPYPEVGDILISASGSIGRTVVYEGEDAYFQDSNIVWLEHDGRLKNSFLEQFLKRTKWNKIEGSTIKRLYNKDILNKKINLPKLKEQEKIGQLFQYLDKTITLHEEKQCQLEQLKKALLQKMFADETGYPVLRFKGFTEKWEQRKLGEIATIVGGGTPSTKNPEYWDGDINWYSPAEIGNQIYTEKSERQITELGLKKSSAKLLPVGTVLFTSRAGIGKTAILNKEACTNQGFQSIIPRSKMLNSYFLFSRTNSLKQYGETMGSGSTFVEVSGKQMSKMPLFIPNINEQSRIAKLFQSLDKTITLHDKKIQYLKQLKRGLLQKMFV